MGETVQVCSEDARITELIRSLPLTSLLIHPCLLLFFLPDQDPRLRHVAEDGKVQMGTDRGRYSTRDGRLGHFGVTRYGRWYVDIAVRNSSAYLCR